MGSVSASLLGVNGSTLLVDSYRWTYEKFCAICLTLPSVELRQDRSFGDTNQNLYPNSHVTFVTKRPRPSSLRGLDIWSFIASSFFLSARSEVSKQPIHWNPRQTRPTGRWRLICNRPFGQVPTAKLRCQKLGAESTHRPFRITGERFRSYTGSAFPVPQPYPSGGAGRAGQRHQL